MAFICSTSHNYSCRGSVYHILNKCLSCKRNLVTGCQRLAGRKNQKSSNRDNTLPGSGLLAACSPCISFHMARNGDKEIVDVTMRQMTDLETILGASGAGKQLILADLPCPVLDAL